MSYGAILIITIIMIIIIIIMIIRMIMIKMIIIVRGHWRSLEVNKGQMEVKNQNLKKSTIWVLLERSSIVEFSYLIFFCH